MTLETEELVRICEALPESKRGEVADFARFLLSRLDDERWEKLVDAPARRPKLEAFLEASKAEERTPLDLEKL